LNRLFRISSNEVFVIAVFASLFLLAGLGETIHVAESIGALLLGLILGETEHTARMERVVVPFRDFFGAIFFFSFGLSINPFSLGGAVWLAIGAALLSLVSVLIAGMVVAKRAGLPVVGALNLSFTLLARGEFSIIIAGLAQAGGLLGLLQPFAALYVLILASAAPLLAKESEPIYNGVMKVVRWRPKRKKKKAEEEESIEEGFEEAKE
jgi:CPA2 family monovalent cation:H+ antiporter-2